MSNESTYEKISNYLINKIESENVLPWHKPWRQTNLGNHMNHVTGHEYSGINAIITGFSNHRLNRWLTFKQVNDLDASIIAGSKGTPIVYFQMLKAKDSKEGKEKFFPLAKYYYVWNISQTTVKWDEPTETIDETINPIASCESIVAGYKNPPEILTGQSAFYRPSEDSVTMPAIGLFNSSESYYATLFHELGHSTGHEFRLNREGIAKVNHFGSHEYSKEELVAEFTAAFLCAEAKIETATIDNSAAYLKNWVKVLRDNPKFLISAASQAQKAANLIQNKEVQS